MLIQGNAVSIPLKDNSVQTVVTSPPYWGLRDYGVPDQLGLDINPRYLEMATRRAAQQGLRI